jgi:hypothetical protein
MKIALSNYSVDGTQETKFLQNPNIQKPLF